jgi:hypothetical protein
MTEPNLPPLPAQGSSNPIGDDAAFDALLRGLASVPPASADVKEAHLTAALGHVSTTGIAPVVSLDSRRRSRFVAMTSVAAAAVFAVGLGIGASFGGSDSTMVVADAAVASAPPVKNAAVTTEESVATKPATKKTPASADVTTETVLAASVGDTATTPCSMGDTAQAITTVSAGVSVHIQRAVVDGRNVLYVLDAGTCEVLFQFDLGG